MSTLIKTIDDINHMREAGRLAAEVLMMIGEHVRAGISTDQLNSLCHDYIINQLDCIPAPLNYGGAPGRIPFPKSICTSVNHVICHGIPSEKKILKDGDIINIDVTVIVNGWYGDTSRMFYVGVPGVKQQRLVQVTYEAMMLGIGVVKPGARIGDIGYAIQQHVEKHNYSVVRDYTGHGIGRIFHDEPSILHYGKKGTGPVLEKNMFFTITIPLSVLSIILIPINL